MKKDITGEAFRANVTDTVFELMRDEIIGGAWKPGEKIPSENKLTALYGVSRVTVRAAIARLTSLGLLESHQGGGTYVCKPNVDDPLNSMVPYFAMTELDRMYVFEFRRTVESGAVALAAERADPAIIERMIESANKMQEAEDPEVIVEKDLEFHRLIAEASGNPLFAKVYDVMYGTYKALIKENVSVVGSLGAHYHYMITHAIQARDKGVASMLIDKHLTTTIESINNIRLGLDKEDVKQMSLSECGLKDSEE